MREHGRELAFAQRVESSGRHDDGSESPGDAVHKRLRSFHDDQVTGSPAPDHTDRRGMLPTVTA